MRWYALGVERRDLYQDDLTEERYPSPVVRDEAAASETLDPDAADDDAVKPLPKNVGGKTALGYPHGLPGGVEDDPPEED